MREMMEVAKALSNLGFWVRVDTRKGTLTVFRSGDTREANLVGVLNFLVEDFLDPE